MNGGLDNDVLVGGLGRDVMTGGGGFERFDFNSAGESLPGLFSRDVITDFVGNGIFAGDVIDVSTIDANVLLLGNQAFNFIGAAAVHRTRSVALFRRRAAGEYGRGSI